MQLVKVGNLADGEAPLAAALTKALQAHGRVLWLVPGGSNLPLSVAVMKKLPDELTARLAILLTDERFGPVGHKDSNLKQLYDLGFMPGQATVVPVLVPGLDLEQTRARYELAVRTAFDHAEVIIGQFGMGADGHIAGILPGSPAVTAKTLAAAYETSEFTRLTLTPIALKRLTSAYVFAFGDSKRTALHNLTKKLPLNKQPAQIIKQIPAAYVYNDSEGKEGL